MDGVGRVASGNKTEQLLRYGSFAVLEKVATFPANGALLQQIVKLRTYGLFNTLHEPISLKDQRQLIDKLRVIAVKLYFK